LIRNEYFIVNPYGIIADYVSFRIERRIVTSDNAPCVPREYIIPEDLKSPTPCDSPNLAVEQENVVFHNSRAGRWQ
jgi:hypothetical protein